MTPVEQKLEAIDAKLNDLIRWASSQKEPLHASLRVTEAAKLLHKDRKTIHRWIAEGKLIKRKGLIPYEQLKPFLS